ncbi:M23 family metallopeptidase [Okeania sp. SIO2B3]|uniref:M23 family metallopeptidase n=1 Tax=Okeania sp. SIO2B3 TaxID=2607784 RepID=UPI0013C1353F|nr:M23 family metallopeptidase [Okeania sp. SIO2B3]NET46210.1 M23 family metallopeptidase [Okeania sp. SIO2B3]
MQFLSQKSPLKLKHKKISKNSIRHPKLPFFLIIKQLASHAKDNRHTGSIKNFLVFLIFISLIYITVLAPFLKTGVKIFEQTIKKIDIVQEFVQDNFHKISSLFPPYYGKSDRFLPYVVHTPYFIDDSPPGAYDFTLEQNGKLKIAIPAPCQGTIRRTRFQGKNGSFATAYGAGQIVELMCDGTNYYWLMGHLVQGSPPRTGTRIKKGQAIGIQGLTGRTSGYHVHAQIHYHNGQRITNRKITRPFVENYIKFLRKGSY